MLMKKIAIVGTISNAERGLESNLRRLLRACSDFEIVLVYLVESDSNDRTLSILERVSTQVSNFKYISLGTLKDEIPNRISRIRHCRNYYVSELRRLNCQEALDYIFVADLDGMNSRVSRSAINSSFIRDDWSVALANQFAGYYDLLALRHPSWCPNDVLNELLLEQDKIDKSELSRFSIIGKIKRRLEFDRARERAIYSRMRRISISSPWIEVSSGFGGLGIYKAEIFSQFDYTLNSEDSPTESEHVTLSNRIIQTGGRIYINPRMINNYFNTYNINRFFIVRQLRYVYWNTRKRIK
jgi:hypothetical protein